MNAILTLETQFRKLLTEFSNWIPPLLLRLLMGYEFWKAGTTKIAVESPPPEWFVRLAENGRFPFPFDVLPTVFNWHFSAYTEVIGAALIILGLGTRYAAGSLAIVTIVAILSVHWPTAEWNSLSELWKGYQISSSDAGNYRVPLMMLLMLLPLAFGGGGKASLDCFVDRWARSRIRAS